MDDAPPASASVNDGDAIDVVAPVILSFLLFFALPLACMQTVTTGIVVTKRRPPACRPYRLHLPAIQPAYVLEGTNDSLCLLK